MPGRRGIKRIPPRRRVVHTEREPVLGTRRVTRPAKHVMERRQPKYVVLRGVPQPIAIARKPHTVTTYESPISREKKMPPYFERRFKKPQEKELTSDVIVVKRPVVDRSEFHTHRGRAKLHVTQHDTVSHRRGMYG